jgi:hypothetical protein
MFPVSKIRIAMALVGIAISLAASAWVVLTERPDEPSLKLEIDNTLKSKPGLRLVSENSEFMRTER